jgi:hypothetical protein
MMFFQVETTAALINSQPRREVKIKKKAGV